MLGEWFGEEGEEEEERTEDETHLDVISGEHRLRGWGSSMAL